MGFLGTKPICKVVGKWPVAGVIRVDGLCVCRVFWSGDTGSRKDNVGALCEDGLSGWLQAC